MRSRLMILFVMIMAGCSGEPEIKPYQRGDELKVVPLPDRSTVFLNSPSPDKGVWYMLHAGDRVMVTEDSIPTKASAANPKKRQISVSVLVGEFKDTTGTLSAENVVLVSQPK